MVYLFLHRDVVRRTSSAQQAILHHTVQYSKVFFDEPVPPGEDKEIRLTVHKAPIKALPVALPLALISWQGSLMLIGVVTLHHWIWNKIHLEMHKPEGRGFSRWPAYKFLARYHYLHHQYPNKNFNVVFPFADYVLKTGAQATRAHVEEMYKLGFYTSKPRMLAVELPAEKELTKTSR
jgi:sterol desaturase/sphingolipid hydroxylase (fatty acid hydroxylase superfamily)